VADEFPVWGADFASLAIAVIVLNQIVGPPAFKWAIKRVGEAHGRAEGAGLDDSRQVLILGMGQRALNLEKRLTRHGWQVQIICLSKKFAARARAENGILVRVVDALGPNALTSDEVKGVDTVVAMLPTDEQNYRACELAYEYIGADKIVAFVRDPAQINRFRALGVSVVEQTTATINLLEEFVRSPASTSLFLGESEGKDVVELKVTDRKLDGVAIRELHLVGDVLILSIRRHGDILVTHGYTRLKLGDRVTVLGTPEAIDAAEMRLAGF
jgi:Trk K+ transport system NAD-binding subunit